VITRTLLVLSFIALSGCAARNVAHNPQDMTPYTSDICFILDSSLTYSERRGIGVLWEQGLRSGVYRPSLEDDNGYFFLGPDNAVCQATPECSEFGTGFGGDGGVWVSKSSENDLRLFVVAGVRESDKEAGVLIHALIKRDYGKMFIFDRNEVFVSEIVGKRGTCPSE